MARPCQAVDVLDAARALVKEAGVHRHGAMILDALDQLDAARKRKREAVADLEVARGDHATALAEATWTLGDYFEVRANKTWLTRNRDGTVIVEEQQRSLTADERKDWISRNAERVPAVVHARKALDAVTERVARAGDDMAQNERAARAGEFLIDAARVELETLAIALRAPQRDLTNGELR